MKITRKGYYTVRRPDGSELSRHTVPDECYEAISADGNAGVYVIEPPVREVEIEAEEDMGMIVGQGGDSSDPLSLPLYDTSNIEHLGWFSVSNIGFQNVAGGTTDGLQYQPAFGRSGAMAYNPNGNGGAGSLYVAGGALNNNNRDPVIAEISIPTGYSDTVHPQATKLQDFVLAHPTAGAFDQLLNPEGTGNGCFLAGLMLDLVNERIIMFGTGYYVESNNQPYCCWVRDSLDLSTGSVSGPYAISSLTNQKFVGGGMPVEIPANWRSTFNNKTHLIGGTNHTSRIDGGNSSGGPVFIAVDIDDITGAAQSTIPADVLCYYAGVIGGDGVATSPALYPFTTRDQFETQNVNLIGDWNGFSAHAGTVILDDSRTIMAFGIHGNSFYDTNGSESGGFQGTVADAEHTEDSFWLYDAQDFKDVLDGTKDPYQRAGQNDINFYERFGFHFTNNGGPGSSGYLNEGSIRAMCYVPDERLAYVMASSGDSNFYPAIHVLRFN